MSSEAKVGLFVIIASAIFVVSFLSIANVQLRGGLARYQTYFSFAGGIEKGTPVRFGGLRVGTVADVRSWAADPMKIEVVMELKPGTPVRQDSVASISTLGMLGENYVEIEPGKKDSAPLPPGSAIPSVEAVDMGVLTRRIGALADSAQPLIEDLHKDLNEISSKAEVLIDNLNLLTGEKNQKSMEALLSDGNKLIAQSNKLVTDLSPRITALTDNLNDTTQKLGVLVNDFGKTNDKAGDLLANLNKTVNDTRDPINNDLTQLQVTLAQTQALLEQMRGTLVYNDENINQMIANFRTTSRNLAELTDEVKQRPFSLIRIRPHADRQVPIAKQSR
jgi:phospholipid/cholesterol/gamma-HCH transport system substrate-binding protein